jgi:hypothetical protein
MLNVLDPIDLLDKAIGHPKSALGELCHRKSDDINVAPSTAPGFSLSKTDNLFRRRRS